MKIKSPDEMVEMEGVFDGDTGLVRILRRDRRNRPEGRLIEVLQHNTETILGRLYFILFAFVC